VITNRGDTEKMAKTIYASDLRPSQLIKYENIAYVVVAREHANIGRGGASVLLSLRQLANNFKKLLPLTQIANLR
jgi:translation elongation factor P/translation initiation factor 5A